MAVEQALEAAAIAGQFGHQFGKGCLMDQTGDLGKGRGQRRIRLVPRPPQHLFLGGGQQFAGIAVVHHLEMGGDGSLQREPAQERLAKGVDGFDMHAAGGVEHLGEQAPGAHGFRLVRRPAQQVGQFPGQGGFAGDGPVGQPAGDAVAHLGGGGLGEGQAQQPVGRAAAQQQGEHPVGQHLGLAGAGGRSHPHRGGGVGGLALAPGGIGDHSPSSSAALAHSLTRARCRVSEYLGARSGWGRAS